MKNNTKIKVAKKYQGMIELIEKDSDGYWAYAKDGFYFGGMGCHTAHEDTQKELLAMIRTLKECDCDDCQSEGEASNEDQAADSSEYQAEANEQPLQDEAIDDAPLSVWLGSLAAYNAGYLVGCWVTLPKEPEELSEIYEAINAEAEKCQGVIFAEEIDVFDINCNVEGIYSDVSRLGIFELNDLADAFESMYEFEKDQFAALIEATDSIEEALEQINEAIVLEDVNNEKDLGEVLHREGILGMHIPDELESFIDFEAIGRDYITGGDWILVESGKAVNLRN